MRALRGEVDGWSKGATRRLRNFLYGVDVARLDGYGYAVTVTMRDTPPSGEAMHAVRRAFLARIERAHTVVRTLWVVEWQERGTPHFHLAIYTAEPLTELEQAMLVVAWTDTAKAYAPKFNAQTVGPITGAQGWLEYLSKHAARGRFHYQRQGKPEGWEKTGRLWGHTGSWPEVAPDEYQVDREAYWHYRRLVRSWRIAQARRSPHPGKSLRAARTMLSRPSQKLGTVAGVSEFIGWEPTVTLLEVMRRQGYQVRLLVPQTEGDQPISGTLTP